MIRLDFDRTFRDDGSLEKLAFAGVAFGGLPLMCVCVLFSRGVGRGGELGTVVVVSRLVSHNS